MRYNIPPADELEQAHGELDCFQVYWPNTPHWRALLAGAIYLLTRGRSWDETSGVITEAQRAAKRLFALNVPLITCAGAVPPGNYDEHEFAQLLGSGGGDEGEDDMWAVTDVTIENGKLVLHYGPCCEKVVDGTLETGGAIETRDPYEGVTDPGTGQPYVGYACGKAQAMVNAVFEALTNLTGSASNPLTVVKSIRQGQPEISFDNLWLWNAYLAYANTYLQDEVDPLDLLGFDGGDAIWDVENILSEKRRLTWICRLAARLTNDTTVTKKEWEELRATGRQMYSIGMGNCVDALILAIGDGDIKSIAAAGAIVSAECDCPELHEAPAPAWTMPSQAGWYWGPVEIDETGSGSATGWNADVFTVTPEHDVYGVMIDIPVVTNPDLTIKVMDTAEFAVPGVNPSIFTNTSGNLRGTNIWGPSTATLNEVMRGYAVNTAKTGEDAGADGWSALLSAPEYIAGSPIELGFNAGWMVAGDFPFTLRFLYNTGSPSHAG